MVFEQCRKSSFLGTGCIVAVVGDRGGPTQLVELRFHQDNAPRPVGKPVVESLQI